MENVITTASQVCTMRSSAAAEVDLYLIWMEWDAEVSTESMNNTRLYRSCIMENFDPINIIFVVNYW